MDLTMLHHEVRHLAQSDARPPQGEAQIPAPHHDAEHPGLAMLRRHLPAADNQLAKLEPVVKSTYWVAGPQRDA